ncbi:MAG: epoxide hydrolase, partial [Acidimicrobiia bacterium]|nr:epoxide hydrolase [Acidimicrobiia bacterium]
MSEAIRPFRIVTPQASIEDLRRRLLSTRWPEQETVDDWSQGTPLEWLKEICDTWANSYDWQQRSAVLNRLDQFVTTIEGLDIHFIHQRSHHRDATPLLMTHGWPGSVFEFQKVIQPLVNPTEFGGTPDDAFHVVCPSLPGFAFSGKPGSTGWGPRRVAHAWCLLMRRLGYEQFLAHGGDLGAAVASALGRGDCDHCTGIHITLAMYTEPVTSGEPSGEEQRALDGLERFQRTGSGYEILQRTRPQTVGYGLVDSPVAQAAWILEKFWEWTDHAGNVADVIGLDVLLDNLTVHWLSADGSSAARMYWESHHEIDQRKVTTPTGVTVYPREIVTPVREWMAPHYPNIIYWNEQPRGGHFAALEVPE